MEVNEIHVGSITTLTLTLIDKKEELHEFTPGSEVKISLSSDNDLVFLKSDQSVHEVECINTSDKRNLNGLIRRQLPKLCWIVSSKSTGGSVDITIQVHEFPGQVNLGENVDIGVDDYVVEHLAKKRESLNNIDSIIEWLNKKMVLNNSIETKPIILFSGSPNPKVDWKRAFRIHGVGFAIDVVRNEDDKLIVKRVVETRRTNIDIEKRPVLIGKGNIRFCDVTVASVFRGEARTQLDQLVQQSDSYLRIWKEYNKLEKESILRRAREFGLFYYKKRERVQSGAWRFFIDNQEDEIFPRIQETSDLLLEASENAPRILTNLDIEWEHDNDKNVFMGKFNSFNQAKNYVDLFSVYEEREIDPPIKGYLHLSLLGDRIRLNRRERAGAKIASAECPMPQLGMIIEGIDVPQRRAGFIEPLSSEVKKRFNGNPNPMQEEALKVALNTPDIALIQGPPGTGKTILIAALQTRLAEIDGNESHVSGNTLLTSYQHDAVDNVADKINVFGLPAIKVGRKMGQQEQDEDAVFNRWRVGQINKVKDILKEEEYPLSSILNEVRGITAAFSCDVVADYSRITQDLTRVIELTGKVLSEDIKDKLEYKIKKCDDKAEYETTNEDPLYSLALASVNALDVTEDRYPNPGCDNAYTALARLERLNILDVKSRDILQKAANWATGDSADIFNELNDMKKIILNRMTSENKSDIDRDFVNEIKRLLLDIIGFLYLKVRDSSGGKSRVIYDYLDDLKNDIEGTKQTVRHYTAVLAATCQQAAGSKMLMMKDDTLIFDNVIVDEAARANPLDLFIPMSMAEKKIVLVGDHRQLPHILEPDIEKMIEMSDPMTTQERLKKSLFQMLFESLKNKEKIDGIKRTVTLDTQYRMHPLLGDFINDNFYKKYGESFGSGKTESDFIHDIKGYEGKVAGWIHIDKSLGYEKGKYSKYRGAEAKWIADNLLDMMHQRPDFSFGVITFYSAQKEIILKHLEKSGITIKNDDESYSVVDSYKTTENMDGQIVERLRVGTVDSFQGKEFDVVLLSLVRSNDVTPSNEMNRRRKFGYLMLENRLCVAMSRQKRLLIVVGDSETARSEQAEEAIPGLYNFYKLFGD